MKLFLFNKFLRVTCPNFQLIPYNLKVLVFVHFHHFRLNYFQQVGIKGRLQLEEIVFLWIHNQLRVSHLLFTVRKAIQIM